MGDSFLSQDTSQGWMLFAWWLLILFLFVWDGFRY